MVELNPDVGAEEGAGQRVYRDIGISRFSHSAWSSDGNHHRESAYTVDTGSNSVYQTFV